MPATSCQDILDYHGSAESGYFWVKAAKGEFKGKVFKVYCDMETFDGGWLLVGQGMGTSYVENWKVGMESSYQYVIVDGEMADDTYNEHISFKMGDARINSLPYTTVRFSGGRRDQPWGNPKDGSHLKNSFFWKDCEYVGAPRSRPTDCGSFC